jgi:predicted RNase H-like HicB family nuclease
MAKKSKAKMPTRYIVTDGELVLEIELDEDVGGYCVTSPFNPDILTQGETLEEAFEMARDCAAMAAARKRLARQKRQRAPRRSAR